MSTLLSVLLILAVVLGVAWYLWRSRRLNWRKNRHRRPERREPRFDPVLDPPPLGTAKDDDMDVAGALADLSGLMADADAEGGSAARNEPPRGSRRRTAAERHGQTALSFDDVPPPAPPPEKLFVLYIAASDNLPIRGPAMHRALEDVGLRYGDMSIYHHHGVGRSVTREPVFSVANMFEPGSFDPDTLDSFETKGLALFMRLPGPMDGPVALELMLSTVQRLAQALSAKVLDDMRAPLTAQTIARLRADAAKYAHVRA